MYQVHIICGANSQVSGPVYCPDGGKSAPHKCLRTHVNFFATCRGAQPEAGRAKMSLFFAELSNEDEAGAQSFCCQVPLLPPCAGLSYTSLLHITSYHSIYSLRPLMLAFLGFKILLTI
jgi:hypothetical protein